MWKDNGRDDILAWVDPIEIGNGRYIYPDFPLGDFSHFGEAAVAGLHE